MSHIIEFNGRKLTAWKTSLHGHSTNSDGWLTPQEVILRYAQLGYDAVNFSDHRKTNPVRTYDGSGMTLISGVELHPMGPRDILWHLLAVGVPEDFPSLPETIEEAVNSVHAAGGLAYIAHPYWCGFTVDELLPIAQMPGVVGVEVSNTSCWCVAKHDSSAYIDALLDRDIFMNIIAVDDAHMPKEFGRNWTMIIAENNTPEALTEALKNGRAYSSQGPEFYKISYQNGVLDAEFSPVAQATVICERGHGRDFSGDDTGLFLTDHITSLHMNRSDFTASKYFRIRICDKFGRCAWSNPVKIDHSK